MPLILRSFEEVALMKDLKASPGTQCTLQWAAGVVQ